MSDEGRVTTAWREFEERGMRFRVRAVYGWRDIGQGPYWSVTGTLASRREAGPNEVWRDEEHGVLHAEIARAFPELRDAIRWHLAGADGTPMHYVENAVFWFTEYFTRPAGAPTADKALAYFKQTVVYGALPGDVLPRGNDRDDLRPVVEAWCAARLPALREQMKRDVAAAVMVAPRLAK